MHAAREGADPQGNASHRTISLQASVFIVCPYDGDNTYRKRNVLSDTNWKQIVLP